MNLNGPQQRAFGKAFSRLSTEQPVAGAETGLWLPVHNPEHPEAAQPDPLERAAGCMQPRWAQEAFPLKVWIEASQDNLAPLFFLTLRDWEAASQGGIQFVNVSDACEQPPLEGVDITVQWVEEATLGRPFEVGHTDTVVSAQGQIVAAHIFLLTAPAIDKDLNPQEKSRRLRATILHEFGHALGLEHSTSPKDVMFHQGWQNPFLSAADTLRLKQLYQLNTLNTRG